MGSGWENPGPSRFVIINGAQGDLLVYDGTLGFGHLVLAVSGFGGSDPYGNAYLAGMTFPKSVSGLSSRDLAFTNPAGQEIAGIKSDMTGLGFANQTLSLFVNNPADTTKETMFFQCFGTAPSAGFRFNNQPPGACVLTNWTWSASRASGALTVLGANAIAPTIHQNTDYPLSSLINWTVDGNFHPPVDSYYDIGFYQNATTGSSRGAAIITKNGVEIEHSEAANNTPVSAKLISEFLLTTDVIAFEPFYVSATTPQTLTGRINIARRLA